MNGVYIYRDETGQAVYVGQSVDVARRADNHKSKDWYRPTLTLEFIECDGVERFDVEGETIMALQPTENIRHAGDLGVADMEEGRKVLATRQELGVSQARVAELAGVSPSMVCYMEKGRWRYTQRSANKVYAALEALREGAAA